LGFATVDAELRCRRILGATIPARQQQSHATFTGLTTASLLPGVGTRAGPPARNAIMNKTC
jgi:hypothetical protein